MTNCSDSIFNKLLLGNIEDEIPMKNLVKQLKITASVKKRDSHKNAETEQFIDKKLTLKNIK